MTPWVNLEREPLPRGSSTESPETTRMNQLIGDKVRHWPDVRSCHLYVALAGPYDDPRARL